MGTKFTTKFWYMQSGDGVIRPILPFKEDQGDSYEQYAWQISITFFNWKRFLTLSYFFSIFSRLVVYLKGYYRDVAHARTWLVSFIGKQ